MNLLAISNANARGVAKAGPSIAEARLPKGSEHHLTENETDLLPVLDRAAKANLRHLVIEGGDGTVRTVMTLLLRHYEKMQALPVISILPGGTTNQIARNLGLKKASDLDAIISGQIVETVTPLVKIKTPLQPKRYGFLFSTGAIPHVSRFAQEQLNERGVGGGSAVVGAVIKAVTSDRAELMPPQTHRLKARLGDRILIDFKGPALGTIMTTLPSLMLGLDPFWGSEDAPLRMTWAEAESTKLGTSILGIWMGRKQDRTGRGYHSHNVDQLRLRTKAPATLDGDFLDVAGEKLKISTSRPVTFWQTK